MMETSIMRFWILDPPSLKSPTRQSRYGDGALRRTSIGFWIEELPEQRRVSRDRRVQPRGGGAEQSGETEGGGGAVASRRRGAAGREHAPAIRSEGAGSGGRCGNRSAER